MDKRVVVWTAALSTMAVMVGIWFWILPSNLQIAQSDSQDVQQFTNEISNSVDELQQQVNGIGNVLGDSTVADTNVGNEENIELSNEQVAALKQQLNLNTDEQ